VSSSNSACGWCNTYQGCYSSSSSCSSYSDFTYHYGTCPSSNPGDGYLGGGGFSGAVGSGSGIKSKNGYLVPVILGSISAVIAATLIITYSARACCDGCMCSQCCQFTAAEKRLPPMYVTAAWRGFVFVARSHHYHS
jgi:hypothetical protein